MMTEAFETVNLDVVVVVVMLEMGITIIRNLTFVGEEVAEGR